MMMNKFKKVVFTTWIAISGLLLIALAFYANPTAKAQTTAGFCFNANPGTIPNPAVTLQIEEGKSKPFTTTLCSKPDSNVTLLSYIYDSSNITDEAHIIVEPLTISFTVDNYNKAQTLDITVNDDDVFMPNRLYKIYFAATSNDENFEWTPLGGPWVQVSVTETDSSLIYLPIIARSEPPKWQRFDTTAGLDLDLLRIHQNRIFVGEKNKGIFEDQASNCSTSANFRQINPQFSIRDLYFRDSVGLAASFGNKVFYSSDILNSWNATQSEMNPFVYGVVKTTNGISFAGTDIGVYKSTDDGINWNLLNPQGINPQIVNGFTYLDSNGDVLWVYTFGNGVSKYQIASNTFTQYNKGLNSTDEKKVLDLLTRSSGNELYIGTLSGVYKGVQDLSSNWQDFGLSGIQVVSLELVGNILYAGTNKQGIWARVLDGSTNWVKQTNAPSELAGSVIRDLYLDTTSLCSNKAENRNGLLAATDKGLWVYR